MERRQLEYFSAVAECGSISAAARRLGVSQPTISQAIARAEESLGVPLLRRDPAGAALTDAGRRLLGPASQVLREFEEVDRALEPMRDLSTGQLSVVCPPTLAQDPMVGLIGRFRRRYPRVTVAFRRPHDWSGVDAVLASGRAEVGVGVAAADHANLVSLPIGKQRIVALVPPDAKVSDEPSLRELLSHGLVTTPPGGVTRQLLVDRLDAQDVDDAVTVETSHQGSMVPLVLAGLGVAFVPEGQAGDVSPLGVQVRAPQPVLTRDLWLLHRRRVSPAAAAFLGLVLEPPASVPSQPES